jgi:thiamine kinase-like enzyme
MQGLRTSSEGLEMETLAEPAQDSLHLLNNELHMQILLQQRLPFLLHETITACRVLQTYCKQYFKEESRAKSYLAIAYELTVCNTATNQTRKQLIYIKHFKDGYSHRAFAKLTPQPSRMTPLHLEDVGMIIWQFPSDPVLSHLPETVESKRVKRHLPTEFHKDDIQVNIEVVNYRPEIRCTAWYELRSKILEKPLMLFGKTYADDRYKDIYQRLQWLYEYTRGQDTFLMPPLAGYSNTIKTFWQHKLEGEPLLQVINKDNYQALLGQAAQRLDFLNHCKMPCPARETNTEQLKEVTKKIKKLTLAFPELQPRLAQLSSKLEETLPGLGPAPQWVVHGDFHLRQMLVRQGQIALFDFDECSLGDPVEDLANFVTDLYTYTFDKSLIEDMCRAFLAAYGQYSDWLVPHHRLTWHLQIQFITRAYRSYLQQKPNLGAVVEHYVSLAENASSHGVIPEVPSSEKEVVL